MRNSTIHRLISGAAAVAAAGIVSVALGSPPASATETCKTTTHGDTTPYTNLGADEKTYTSGKFTLTDKGVKLETPENSSKVYGYFNLQPAVKLADIKAAGFKNLNTSGLAPSYQFGLNINGAWGGTLAWEAVYQDAGKTGTEDVLHGGASKWYITKNYPATGTPVYTAHTTKTWTEILALLPADTTAVYFGLNQGSGGIADNTVDKLKLVTKHTCTIHTWGTQYTSPSPSPSKSSSAPASASASASVSAPASASTSASAAPGLPVTGSSTGTFAAVGGGLVVAGGVLVVALRRRRKVRFTA